MKMAIKHVVVVTYGEPPTPAFKDQLVYSWRILLGLTRTIAPIPKPVLPLIALSRARFRNRLWTAERYRSPLEPLTARQGDELWVALTALDPSHDWRVQVAYEFRAPLLRDVLAAMPDDEPAVVIPMYAAESDFTHALSRAVVTDVAHSRSFTGQIRVLPALDARRLGDIAAAHVLAAVQTRQGWYGNDVALVLAAHGTLVNPSRPIDTGLEATQGLCDAIRTRLAGKFGLVANGWLNHTRGGRWTEPAIDDALRQVAAAGFKRVVYFPYGFLADNAESELEGRIALKARPELESWHLPCLNESPMLIDALARDVTGIQGRQDFLPARSGHLAYAAGS
jgi:protoheme ferro-lyase